MRDEGFGMSPGTLVQLNTSHVPSFSDINECFDDTGALMQLAADEPFDNSGALMQLSADEPFMGVGDFPQLEYSTSVNKVDRKIDKQIYDNLTIQGMNRMSPDSKYTPYHCPKGLME